MLFHLESRFGASGCFPKDLLQVLPGGFAAGLRAGPGDNVVISGQIKLQPHARVRIDNSDLLKPPAKRPLE